MNNIFSIYVNADGGCVPPCAEQLSLPALTAALHFLAWRIARKTRDAHTFGTCTSVLTSCRQNRNNIHVEHSIVVSETQYSNYFK